MFPLDGRIFQVEYAQEAVKKGSTPAGVCGKNIVVPGVEKKAVAALQKDWQDFYFKLFSTPICELF